MREKSGGIDLGTTNSVMAVVREDVPELFRWGRMTSGLTFSGYFSNISGKTMCLLVKEASSAVGRNRK